MKDDIIKIETELSQYQGEDRVISSHELAEEIKTTARVYSKIGTGFPTLDRLLGQTEHGELIIVTGPTGEGKTTLLMTITRKLAENNVPAVWFTLEVTPQQFIEKLSNGADLPLFYIPRKNEENTIVWIEKRIIESKVKYNTQVVFIDHIHQIFSLERFSKNVSLEIGDLVAKIKQIAIDHHLVVYLIAHTKDNPMSPTAEPRKEDIRDSGLISRLADTIIGIWRIPESDDGKSGKRKPIQENDTKSKIAVFKNRRNGKQGSFVAYHKDHTLIEANIVKDYEIEY